MARYVWNGSEFVHKHTGLPMEKPYDGQICTPTVISDIEPYTSPVTGKTVGGRADQREDLARTGSRLVDPSENEVKYHSKRYAKANNALDKWTGKHK